MAATPPAPNASNSSSDYYEQYEDDFLEILDNTVLPGDKPEDENEDEKPPPSTQPGLKRRYVEDENQDTYGAAHFGDFGEYMRRKRAKLQIQNANITNDTTQSDIFHGISIYVNGWTKPSVQELRNLIVQHGGVFQPYLDRKSLVTHIITCSLTPAKLREFQHMKVVRPEWLVDSVALGAVLPWRDYIFQMEERAESAQGSRPTQIRLETKTASSSRAPQKPIGKDPPSAAVPSYAAHDSNPNAQRVMANPQWRAAHTSAAGSHFIEGFYKNSRLHHLATWKAELKGLVQEAQRRVELSNPDDDETAPQKVAAEEPSGVSMRGAELVLRSPTKALKGKGKAREDPDTRDRVIMHCDFDAFFVSASLAKKPHLRGKPVVVCHSQGGQGGTSSTSEIASASYEARTFGIKNGMSLQQARTLCPAILTLPYEFELYKAYSLKFYTILMSHVDDLQAVSVDEALVDVTSAVARARRVKELEVGDKPLDCDPAKEFAETLRTEVKKVTGCEISIGIAHNILLARLATRRAKPAGSYHLLPDNVAEFIAPLDITDLWGFGHSTKQKAQDKLGTTLLGELAGKSKSVLSDALGKSTGETLYNAIRGIDHTKLESDKPRKSVSCEINYGIRFENNEQAEQFIFSMAEEVVKRLNDVEMLGGSITLKVMKRDPDAPVEPPKFLGHGACDVFNKQGPLLGPDGRATSDVQAIGLQAWKMLKAFDFDPKELRGIGIHINKLEPASGERKLEPGQGRLQFQKNNHPPAQVTSGPESPPKHPREGSSAQLTSNWDLPAFSQINMSVFNELPEDIRNELKSEYKRRSESPFPQQLAPKPKVPFRFPPPRSKPLFRKAENKPNWQRITGQLAPRGRGRAGFSPRGRFPRGGILPGLLARSKTDIGLKRKGTTSTHVTDDEIRALGFDPEVFAELPPAIREEQLCRVRLIRTYGGVPEVSGERKILKRKVRPPDPNIVRLPPPQAKHSEVASLKRPAQKKGDPLPAFTEKEDIQDLIKMWVARHTQTPPRPKDIQFFSNYLLRSVDMAQCGGTGMEKAIAVLKWWLILLRKNWGSYELVDPDEEDEGDTVRSVACAWWGAFQEVKEKMDAVSKKRFGGRISLR